MGTCAVLSTLQSGDEEVESALVPFLQAYVAKLRAGQKRGSPASQVRAASHAPRATCSQIRVVDKMPSEVSADYMRLHS